MTRAKVTPGKPEYRIGEWWVRPPLNRLDKDGISVDLEPRLMDLLVCLAERAGEVVSKDELLDRVWKVEHVSDGTLSHAVADLRRFLDDDARQPRYIETIRKRGYRLVATVNQEAAIPPPPINHRKARPRWLARAAIAVCGVASLAGIGWFAAHRSSIEPSTPPRIVILPFENLGGDDSESFATGLTDEIISRLAAVRGLQVVSRTTAFNVDPTGKTAQDIGRELGVEYILEGAVRWSADIKPPVVRVTPQLIRVDCDGHLWSGQFNRHPEAVLDVQSEIAQHIVAQLDLRLARDERDIVETPPTTSPVAYRAFLEALERRGSTDAGNIIAAAQMFRRAVEADPAFAQAWAGLSEANGAYHHMGFDREPARCEAAELALEQARKLAPESPDTMRAAAYFEYHCRHDVVAARAAFERTLNKWHGDAQAMTGMAYVCRRMGQWNDAVAWFRRALELDPRNPTILWPLGQTLISVHEYEKGLVLLDRAIELAPDIRSAHFTKVSALWLGWGDTRGAAEVLDRWPGERNALWYEYAFLNTMYSGDFPAALRVANESPPGPYSQLHRCLALTLLEAPDIDRVCSGAVAIYQKERDLYPDDPLTHMVLAQAYSLTGHHDDAATEAAAAVALRTFDRDAYVYSEALLVQALVWGRAGRTEEAIGLIERLLTMPSHISPARLRIDPEWASIRHHPRFQEIIRNGTPIVDHGTPAVTTG